MEIKLPNGLVLTGTPAQVADAAKLLNITLYGDSANYFSTSKGLIPIKSMNSIHLRNAILKIYSEWVDALHAQADPKTVVNLIVEGITDRTWLAMVKELSTRKE